MAHQLDENTIKELPRELREQLEQIREAAYDVLLKNPLGMLGADVLKQMM